MEKNFLNPFAIIVSDEDQLFFAKNSLALDMTKGVKKTLFNEEAMALLKKEGEINMRDLEDSANEETLAFLKSQNILINTPIQTEDYMARTMGYYLVGEKINPSRLKQKKVLLLGCGSLGTHIAWNLIGTGLGNLSLLDCDQVEISNLNRQIMFDLDDLGKDKVEVLKTKLNKINPDIVINTIHRRIDSKESLRLVLSSTKPDLVIKTIDSPESFHLWLDSLCEELTLTSISGALTGTFSVIGPTYRPGFASKKYSDFFPDSHKYRHLSGTTPSISFEVSHAAAIMTAESIRYLTGYGELEFEQKVDFEDVLLKQKMSLTPSNFGFESKENIKFAKNFLLILLYLLFGAIVVILKHPQLLFVLLLVIPFTTALLFKSPEFSAMSAFTATSIYIFIASTLFLVGNIEIIKTLLPLSLLSLAFGWFILLSLLVFLSSVISYGGTKLINLIQLQRNNRGTNH